MVRLRIVQFPECIFTLERDFRIHLILLRFLRQHDSDCVLHWTLVKVNVLQTILFEGDNSLLNFSRIEDPVDAVHGALLYERRISHKRIETEKQINQTCLLRIAIIWEPIQNCHDHFVINLKVLASCNITLASDNNHKFIELSQLFVICRNHALSLVLRIDQSQKTIGFLVTLLLAVK